MNIYVGNLSYDTTEEELQEMFGAFGSIASVNIIKDRDTGKCKGFGFIEMDDQTEAEKAISEIDGKSVGGRDLRVNQARPKTERAGGGSHRSW